MVNVPRPSLMTARGREVKKHSCVAKGNFYALMGEVAAAQKKSILTLKKQSLNVHTPAIYVHGREDKGSFTST